MQTIPVFDLKNRRLVAGHGGQRGDYQPVEQVYDLPGRSPLDWAAVLRNQFQVNRLYIADLDAMTGADDAAGWELADRLLEQGWEIWLDAGDSQQTLQRHVAMMNHPQFRAIIPTEARGQDLTHRVWEFLANHGNQSVISLDWQTTTRGTDWFGTSMAVDLHKLPEFLQQLRQRRLSRVIVLDLTDVGSGRYTHWNRLVQIGQVLNDWEWITGGGISQQEDLDRLARAGAWGALVGSWFWRRLAASGAITKGPDQRAGQGDQ